RPHSAAGGGGGPPPHIEPLADEVPTSEVRALLRRFGHADFRPGQADAIGRVLAGRSALALMEDQLSRLPACLPPPPVFTPVSRPNCATESAPTPPPPPPRLPAGVAGDARRRCGRPPPASGRQLRLHRRGALS
uniref:CSTF2_hinge domain-containing protein n=1 Tax=Macrostomum lignano TaxID=282301 RepID=A0A1I8F4M7_9PLAT